MDVVAVGERAPLPEAGAGVAEPAACDAERGDEPLGTCVALKMGVAVVPPLAHDVAVAAWLAVGAAVAVPPPPLPLLLLCVGEGVRVRPADTLPTAELLPQPLLLAVPPAALPLPVALSEAAADGEARAEEEALGSRERVARAEKVAAPLSENWAEREAEGGGLSDAEAEALPNAPVGVGCRERDSSGVADEEGLAVEQGDEEAGGEGDSVTLLQALAQLLNRGLQVTGVPEPRADTLPLPEGGALADGVAEYKSEGFPEGEAGLGVDDVATVGETTMEALGGGLADPALDGVALGKGELDTGNVGRALLEAVEHSVADEESVTSPVTLADPKAVRENPAVAEGALEAGALPETVPSALLVAVAQAVPLPLPGAAVGVGSTALPDEVAVASKTPVPEVEGEDPALPEGDADAVAQGEAVGGGEELPAPLPLPPPPAALAEAQLLALPHPAALAVTPRAPVAEDKKLPLPAPVLLAASAPEAVAAEDCEAAGDAVGVAQLLTTPLPVGHPVALRVARGDEEIDTLPSALPLLLAHMELLKEGLALPDTCEDPEGLREARGDEEVQPEALEVAEGRSDAEEDKEVVPLRLPAATEALPLMDGFVLAVALVEGESVARGAVAVTLLLPLTVRPPSEGEGEALGCSPVALGLPVTEAVLLPLALRSGLGESERVPEAQPEAVALRKGADGEARGELLPAPVGEAAPVLVAEVDAARGGEAVAPPPPPPPPPLLQAVGDAQLLPLAAPRDADPLPLAVTALTLAVAHDEGIVLGRALALVEGEGAIAVPVAGCGEAQALGEEEAEGNIGEGVGGALRVPPPPPPPLPAPPAPPPGLPVAAAQAVAWGEALTPSCEAEP